MFPVDVSRDDKAEQHAVVNSIWCVSYTWFEMTTSSCLNAILKYTLSYFHLMWNLKNSSATSCILWRLVSC